LSAARDGFTLVEVMVSMALLVLIMSIFAQIFVIASDTIKLQRGIAENDQRMRTLTTVIKNDLTNKTMLSVVPFRKDEVAASLEDVPFSSRRGYFYVSENDLANDADDVLQFTISVAGADPLYAKATLLPLNVWTGTTGYAVNEMVVPTTPNGFGFICTAAGTTGGGEPAWPSDLAAVVPPDGSVTWQIISLLNQPMADDGVITFEGSNSAGLVNDGSGSARDAEVCYFLRNGNLYRRVLAIRDPYELLGATDDQPQAAGPNLFIPGDYPTTNSFWNDFDYSAYYLPGTGVQFHGSSDLDAGGAGVFQLGRPMNRFGHDHVNGNPREWTDNTDVTTFFGRYTHEETSNLTFGYPGRIPGGSSPMSQATAWVSHAGGPRRGEEILLSNVHSFDVKVWDDTYNEDANGNGVLDAGEDANRNGTLETAGGFADVGHGATGGDYRQAINDHVINSINYGPASNLDNDKNRIYDTWYPGFDINGGGNDEPPFRPNFGGDPTNPKQLESVQITIRFFDVSSDSMRQLSLVVSLIN